MGTVFSHLGIYSDIIDEGYKQAPIYPTVMPGPETQKKVREVLGWCDRPEEAIDLQVERFWEKDGLVGEELSWWVGYGPRTRAWLIKPAGAKGPLPAVLGLHDHGGFKYFGKEKIAEGPDALEPCLQRHRDVYYGGRSYVNELAKKGFAVLVHDTFLWGSRKFPVETMQTALDHPQVHPDMIRWYTEDFNMPVDIAEYNYLCGQYEHLLSKYLNLLGTGIPGVVCHEDRIALGILRSRQDVQAENVACIGLSGGGNRAGMLRATAEGLKAAVVVGLMSTYPGLFDHNVDHTWMLYPFGWARYGDWPDLVACQAPAPLLVQYDEEDNLFVPQGMQDAHERLKMLYHSVGGGEFYTGQFYPGPHKFDLQMQAAAWDWLRCQVSPME
jgi:dienelactone hydrolase